MSNREFHSGEDKRLLFTRERFEVSFGIELTVLGCGLDVRHQAHVVMISNGHGIQRALTT
ncbi:MAG: hypothetical protein IIB35_13685 [Gemmatimonadetes bacterium]|nr:hypothetical protein [Gemmatimonadota bacterium]